MSRLSNGPSTAVSSGHNGYTNGTIDFHIIGKACMEGLKQAKNELKDLRDRGDSLEQNTSERLSELDLRMSAVESGHQALQTLTNENNTLKHSLNALSQSINPAWRSDIDSRLADYDLLAQKMHKMEEQMAAMSRLLEAKAVATSATSSAIFPSPSPVTSHSQAQSDTSVSSRSTTPHPSGLVTSATSVSSPAAPTIASPAKGLSMIEPVTPSKPVTIEQNALHNETVDEVVRRKSQHASTLDTCLQILDTLTTSRDSDAGFDDTLADDTSALSQIDFSVPLVDKKAFEHKRDWVQAWQQALEQVQHGIAQTSNNIAHKAALLHASEKELQDNEQAVLRAGSQLKDILIVMQSDCDRIEAVKAMQEDHEQELLKRLRQVEEQEEMIRQDGYIMSIKGRRAYDKEAADYMRVQELRDLKRELQTRIQSAIDYEQRLLHSGKEICSMGQLPTVDDLPSI